MRWLIIAAWIVWGAAYWGLGLRAVRAVRVSIGQRSSVADQVVMAMVPLLTIAMLADLAVTTLRTGSSIHDGLATVAVLGVLAGMMGTVWGRRTLRHCWNPETTIVPAHRVVETGPYRVIRHPIYASALVMFAATAAAGTAISWLLFAGIAAGYLYKTNYEDKFLAARLDGYDTYRRRVRFRLLPGVW